VSLWFIVGQFGILLEFIGALVIVVAAIRNRKKVANLNNTWEGIEHLDEVREAIQGQAITEFRGFLLLGVGLAFQFIGGFST
jgi:CHASE3 domain sensor protein